MKRRFLTFLVILLLLPTFLFAGKDPTFAVVLSGGGARGLSHISVLEELERRGIEPDYIVGTSMGALVGAFYAAGYSASELRTLVEETDLMGIFLHMHSQSDGSTLRVNDVAYLANIATLDFSKDNVGSSNGIMDDQYVAAFLRENLIKVLDVDDFDDLQTPFRCIGTDLVTGEEIVFEDGYLFNAIRGSMSLPIIFRPARTDDGRYVIDGGMLNNLPTDVARELGADYVLAVDVNNALGRQDVLSEEVLETLTGASFQFLDLITQVNSVANYEYADWVLVPELDSYATVAFDAKDEILAIGDRCVQENKDVFDEIEEKLAGRDNPERRSYFDLPDFVFQEISYPGLEMYHDYFDQFVGKAGTPDVMQAFEGVLSYIRDRERLKNIYYVIDDGRVDIVSEAYEEMPASISLGLMGDVGFQFRHMGREVGFTFDPKFSTFFHFILDNDQTLVLGAAEDEYMRIYTAYHYRALRNLGLFAELSFGFGNLSMLSIPDRFGAITTDDFQTRIKAGLKWDLSKNMNLMFAFTLDYDYLDAVVNPADVDAEPVWGDISFWGPRFTFAYSWKEYLGLSLYDTGMEMDIQFDILARAPLTYRLEFGVDSVIYSPIPHARFLLSANAVTARSQGDAAFLSDFYTTTYTGMITRDYISLDFGGRLIFDHLFFDILFYVEALEGNPDVETKLDWIIDSDVSLVPFSGLNDVVFGGSFAVGYNMKSGNVMLNFKINHRGQMYVGIVLK